MKSLKSFIKDYTHESILFLALIISFSYVLPRWADPFLNSRLDMVVAVVDDQTFEIDKYVSNTVDYAKVGDHYYSDKAPGAAFLGIPIYAAIRFVLDLPFVDSLVARLAQNDAFKATLNPDGTGIFTQKLRFAIAQVVLTFFLSAIPSALIGTVLFRSLKIMQFDAGIALLVVYGYALLTPVFTYGGALYGHQLSAFMLFIAFYLVFSKNNFSFGNLFTIGVLLAYAFITEYPTLLLCIILAIYLLRKVYLAGNIKQFVGFLLSGGMIAIFWMMYNQAIFGGPFNLGYNHSELWQDQHQTGFMSLTYPHWDAFWGLLFSKFRGLFFYSPFLLLSVPGIIIWIRSKAFRFELATIILIVFSMVIFGISSVMWWGGFAVGPRYLLPMLPFFMMPIAFLLHKYRESVSLKLITIILGIWSFITIWGVSLASQSYPHDTLMDPLLQHALPSWRSGNIARNIGTLGGLPGAVSVIPLILFLIIVWILHCKINGRKITRKQPPS